MHHIKSHSIYGHSNESWTNEKKNEQRFYFFFIIFRVSVIFFQKHFFDFSTETFKNLTFKKKNVKNHIFSMEKRFI